MGMEERLEWDARLAVLRLQRGGVILYPTDSIWGLGCDATNPEAIERVKGIKRRADRAKALVALVDGLPMLERYVMPPQGAAHDVVLNASRPTTVIYPAARGLPANLLAPDGSVALRITAHPLCRAMCRLLGRPIVSTSANMAGTPYQGFESFPEELLQEVDYIAPRSYDISGETRPSRILRARDDGTLETIRE